VTVPRERRRAPLPVGTRGWLLVAIVACALAAWLALGLAPADLAPRRGGGAVLVDFLRGMVAPALDYESAAVPRGAQPLVLKVARAAWSTVAFAAAAMSLALAGGGALGLAASRAWWSREPAGGRSALARALRRAGATGAHAAVRALIAGMRSVHELLWAVLFLAAFGLNTFSAVIAIAIPYAGTLAKVFAEMLDETPPDSARSLRAAGATETQAFLFGLLPRALPDMSAYAFYRFECAVRSSAVLGFFGFPTLGYHMKLAADDLHYREVWTYLYALLAIVVLLELWSGALRRRVVIR